MTLIIILNLHFTYVYRGPLYDHNFLALKLKENLLQQVHEYVARNIYNGFISLCRF